MSAIDIFSRIEIPKDEVFKYLSNLSTLSRITSPLFKLENLNSTGSKIDQSTSFSQKCVFMDLLQLFFSTKEIIPSKKILFQFDGLIKGTQCIYLIEDENSCIIKEKLEFSLFNQFNFPIVDFLLTLLFYFDTCVKHFILRSIIYKDTGFQKPDNYYSVIRSYITIEANNKAISSFFEDLNKFSVWLSPFLMIETQNQREACEEEKEFILKSFLGLLPTLSCRINKKCLDKVVISFSSPLLKGRNTWSIFPCENEFVIQNTIELDYISVYLKMVWPIIGNLLIRSELNSWNKRLKEVVEKTNLSRFFELSLYQI